MKRILLLFFITITAVFTHAQTTYYWVGGKDAAPQNISLLTNWNTLLDGTGSPRASSTGATDILIFDGANYGGSTLTTGTDSVNMNSGITCGQLKFINSAKVIFTRGTSGTSTLTIVGDGAPATEDFLIETGCSASLSNGAGSQVIVMGGTNNSGRVSGDFRMVTGLQARIANGTSAGTTLVFTAGSTFTTNITSGSAAYAFGTNSQSTEKWVTFQAGSTLYYDGGFSPMGSSATFQPVTFQQGSSFVMRASNPATGAGTFFNRKGYANITVQNGATLTADGSINQIDTVTITAGSTFITHTSGQTVVSGNLNVQGTLSAPGTSTGEMVFAGNVPQTVSGTGIISVPSLSVTDGAHVILEKSITVSRSAVINGKIDFGAFQLTGAGSFTARGATAAANPTGNRTAGSYILTGVAGAGGLNRGLTISGAGLQPDTRVISYTTNFDSIYISRPALTSGTATALGLSSNAATLITANPSGFDAGNGSVSLTDVRTYEDGINYTINSGTTAPFGITTGSGTSRVSVGDVLLNATVTTNATASIYGSLQATAGKTIIRPLDTLWLMTGAALNGSYNASNYFVTDVTAGGNVGVFGRNNVSGSTLFPVGTASHYLPVLVNPASSSDFAINVFQGITTDATPNGAAFNATQKQTVVDAVWNVNRVNGTGDADLKLQWTPTLEGTTLATFANSEMGIIKHTGSSWSLPFGVGDNTANTADTTFNVLGQFSVGARPPANPFVFNQLPAKTYGDPDFSPGVISSNTSMPINYTSSNPLVATIAGGNLRITGTGTTTITATQASDGFYPAANVSQSLTVSKAALTIKADRKVKPEGDPNPPLTATYTGFVPGETPAVLLTQAVLSTTATTASLPGNYLITVSGATASHYNITFINDSLIVRPRSPQTITLPAFTTRTYGVADFAIGASSTNNTLPITFTSSNTAVAAIAGNNIRIVGAGTTTITASQAGNDLFFPAPNVSQTLTVNKAPLTIRVTDTTKGYGQPNPAFRIVYTSFVLGENASVLTTQPAIATTATTNSAPGYYSLDPVGAVAANYNITTVSGRLTIYPASGTGQANLQAFAPNTNSLTVRIFSPEPELGDVIIYDLNGRPVARKNVFMPQGFISASFATGALPSGIYVVQVIGSKTNLKLTVPILHQ
jgi:hypothetical protein